LLLACSALSCVVIVVFVQNAKFTAPQSGDFMLFLFSFLEFKSLINASVVSKYWARILRHAPGANALFLERSIRSGFSYFFSHRPLLLLSEWGKLG
jgi:hypothetical protein